MNVLAALITAIWMALPAYIPNNVAVLAGGGRPIDGGRDFRGARLLGDGKTWRGTAAGVLAGVATALVLNGLVGFASRVLGVDLPIFPLDVAIAFPAGALLGDILASFLKRRIGRARGSAFPVVDQLDFLAVALGLGFLIAPGWMRSVLTPLVLVTLVVLTPGLHLLTNGIAYVLGLKNEPW